MLKRLISALLVFAVLFVMPFPAASAEDELYTQEQVFSLMESAKWEYADSLSFLCSQELYDALLADGCFLLSALLVMSGAEASVWLDDYMREITLTDLSYPEIPWISCGTEYEVQEALYGFGADHGAFYLICPPDLTAYLLEERRLDSYAAQAGFQRISWDLLNTGILYLYSLVPFDLPYALVWDADQFSAAVEAFAREGQSAFYIVFSPEMNADLNSGFLSLRGLAAASVLDSFSCSYNVGSGVYLFSDIEYVAEPQLLCRSEYDVYDAIRGMGARGVTAFQLRLVDGFGEELLGESLKRLHELESGAGLRTSSLAISSDGDVTTLYYADAEILPNAVALDTLDGAALYMEMQVMAGSREINLFCSQRLFDALLGGLTGSYTPSNAGMERIVDLLSQAGVFDYVFSIDSNHYAITVKVKSLYPGFEIIRALNRGTETSLSPRLRETLEAARAMADNCKGDSPLQTAANIHDALCAGIVYTDDRETDEDDTAVGALLSGKANCDGYADAFFLVGSLAGLKVRYQHGDAVGNGYIGLPDTDTHMWNLLEIDGTWRLVDVTFDDSGEEIQYTWFDLGYDRASRCHVWNEDVTVSLLEKTDLSARPENEFSVLTREETLSAVDTAMGYGYSSFYLIFDDEAYNNPEAALTAISRQSFAAFAYSWNSEMRMLSVYR